MIKFYDLYKSNSKYIHQYSSEINKVIKSNYFINSKNVKKFEESFAKYCGAKYCAAVGNGYDALNISFNALIQSKKIKKGDEVIVPANTYIASILPITNNGLKPILVEPDIHSLNIDVNLIEKSITNKTKCILVVHLYGNPANMQKILKLKKKYNLYLIEDVAQAHGAMVNYKKVGTFGIAGCFSFFPGKNLGCFGDAGAIITNDEKFYKIAKSISNYGENDFKNYSDRKYENIYLGVNSRMDEIQAVILNLKLKKLDFENEERKKIANLYNEHIKNILINKPNLKYFSNSVWHLYTIFVDNRSKFIDYMKKKGIQTMIHYPIPPYKQNCYKKYFIKKNYSITNWIHGHIVSLPLQPYLPYNQVMKIIKILNSYQ